MGRRADNIGAGGCRVVVVVGGILCWWVVERFNFFAGGRLSVWQGGGAVVEKFRNFPPVYAMGTPVILEEDKIRARRNRDRCSLGISAH